jgi:hypothetical protein
MVSESFIVYPWSTLVEGGGVMWNSEQGTELNKAWIILIYKTNCKSGAVITMLDFLLNFQMGSISLSPTLHGTRKACKGQTLQSVVETGS